MTHFIEHYRIIFNQRQYQHYLHAKNNLLWSFKLFLRTGVSFLRGKKANLRAAGKKKMSAG